MMSNNLPANYVAAKQALYLAKTVDDVKDILDKSEAMEIYAKKARDSDLIGWATEIKEYATRKLGELMDEKRRADERAKVGRPRQKEKGVLETPFSKPTLAAQSIDKNLAKRARAAAKPPEKEFSEAVAKKVRLAKAIVEGNRAFIKELKAEVHAEKATKRAEREVELGDKQRALPDKKYGVILADPEWKFETYSPKGLDVAPDNHYPTSDLQVIKGRGVETIAADDCVLFLWATIPMLAHCLEVMAAWGFTYKSHCVWIKDKFGTGYWFRGKHELLLVGTRGKIPAPSQGAMLSVSTIEAPVGAHSAKPEVFLEMIERYYPTIPKIELNRRGPARPGWDAWGLEAQT